MLTKHEKRCMELLNLGHRQLKERMLRIRLEDAMDKFKKGIDAIFTGVEEIG